MHSYLSGKELNQMFSAMLPMFELNVDTLNKLNVFPVPDGDTGINMFLTLKDAFAEVEKTTSPSESSSDFLKALSKGALFGARGNSGVILSQFLKGFEIASNGMKSFDSSTLVESLRQSSIYSYNSVTDPKEGTMLTIIKSASDAATKHYSENPNDLDYLMNQICISSKKTLAETPSMLKVLRDAGVVDSGGHGIYIILDGIRQFCKTGTISLSVIPPPIPSGTSKHIPQTISADFVDSKSDEEFGHCTQFLILEPLKPIVEIQKFLQGIASSVVVVGDEGSLVRVHCHSETPQQVITFGRSIGELDDINIQNMDDQFEELKNNMQTFEDKKDFALVPIVPGLGFDSLFKELGAHSTIPSGEKMNPSTNHILTVIDSLDFDDIVILPNHKNILLTTNQAAKLSSKNVHVLPTQSIAEGISAMMSYLPHKNLLENFSDMQNASKNVISGEINTAIRDAEIQDFQILKGQKICSFDNMITSVADNIFDSLSHAIKTNIPIGEDNPLITLYRGKNFIEADAIDVVDKLRNLYPKIGFEMIFGGQSNPELLISIE
jgi:DAK2 domain fusion protein YloV